MKRGALYVGLLLSKGPPRYESCAWYPPGVCGIFAFQIPPRPPGTSLLYAGMVKLKCHQNCRKEVLMEKFIRLHSLELGQDICFGRLESL